MAVAGDRPDLERSKVRLLREVADGRRGAVLVVGDTEEEITAARTLNLPVVAVLTGLRDRPFLEALQPDLIVPSVAELPGLLGSLLPALPVACGVALGPVS